MGFGFKQPLVGEKRCVTTLITAAKETTENTATLNICKNAFATVLHLTFPSCAARVPHLSVAWYKVRSLVKYHEYSTCQLYFLGTRTRLLCTPRKSK